MVLTQKVVQEVEDLVLDIQNVAHDVELNVDESQVVVEEVLL